MNTFDYSSVLSVLALGVTNFFLAGVLYRSIINSSTLLRRRHFFESLAMLAFVLAFLITAVSFALWRENPHFVLLCTGIWVMSCLAFTALVWSHDSRHNDDLALPDVWPSPPRRLVETDATASNLREQVSYGPNDETRERMSSLDAFTRARLKKARCKRSVGEGYFLNNRLVYRKGKREKNDRTDRD